MRSLFSKLQKAIKAFATLFDMGSLCPHTQFVINEVNIGVWNCTPLLEGSVLQTQMPTSFLARKAQGVRHLAHTRQSILFTFRAP